jgi:hypothetical protein
MDGRVTSDETLQLRESDRTGPKFPKLLLDIEGDVSDWSRPG